MSDLSSFFSELNEIEIKIINSIYKYNYTEIQSIKYEELASQLNIELDDLQGIMNRLINNNIVLKNGDRFNVNDNVVKELISMGILDINGVISNLSVELYNANLALDNLKAEMSSIKNELSEIKETYKDVKKN